MSGIFILVYGPITLAVLSVALVRLLVRPKLKVPVYTGANARVTVKMPDGRKYVVGSFRAVDLHYDPGNVYVLKGPQ